VWDRSAEILRGRSGTQRLAVTNPGTIPDRGLFGVFLPDGARVCGCCLVDCPDVHPDTDSADSSALE